jgi:hypothetical protein
VAASLPLIKGEVALFLRRLYIRDYKHLDLFPPPEPDPAGAHINTLLHVQDDDQPSWSFVPKPEFHPLDKERYVQHPQAAIMLLKEYKHWIIDDLTVGHQQLRRDAPNLSRPQRQQLERLLENASLAVVKSDKSCGPVLMNSDDYCAACLSTLAGSHVRVHIDHDILISQVTETVEEALKPYLDATSPLYTPLPRWLLEFIESALHEKKK